MKNGNVVEYDPRRVEIMLAGQRLEGYAPDTKVSCDLHDGVWRTMCEHEELIASLFPWTPIPRPIPWLEIDGGLLLWQTRVDYERVEPHRVKIRVTLSVPMVGDLALVPLEELPTSPWGGRTIPRVQNLEAATRIDLERSRDIRGDVLKYVRTIAMHEVLESLRVDGKPFFEQEVDALHPRKQER